MAALHVETQVLSDPTSSKRNGSNRSLSALKDVPLAEKTTADPNPSVVSPSTSSDPDKDHLYIPWQSRVERVKALKTRDLERQRSCQDSVSNSKSLGGDFDATAGADASSHEDAERKESAQSVFLPLQGTKDYHLSTQPNTGNNKSTKPTGTSNAFSPIILVAEQPPCPAVHQLLLSPSPLHNLPANSLHPFSVANPIPHRKTSVPSPLLAHHPTVTARTPSPTLPGAQNPSASSSRPPSHTSYASMLNPGSYTAELEARVLAMEKKNLLLEKALMTVINATSGMACERGDGCERASWGTIPVDWRGDGRGKGERMSGVSEDGSRVR